MRTLLLSAASLALLCLSSCGSSGSEPTPDPYDTVSRTDEFVSAKVDGQFYDCTAKFQFAGANDTLYNGYQNFSVANTMQLRQVDIFRMENTGGNCRRFTVMINGLDLDAATLPLELTTSNLPVISSVTFSDYTPSQLPNQNPDPNVYVASTADGMTVKLLSKTNDMLVGTFRGSFKNRNNQTKNITEGQFRIRLLRKTRP
ncbi:hypothetical protein KBK19_12310 [Microvirga sp. STR05]|uniref:Lipoprotein n=2 Tax=Hymenobacter TaxID=89966 RepID=A0A7G7W5C0_9BACT|nr:MULTISPECIES: hypothetical protein [Hymenobacter]MBD2715819.1 hypothetical protein [Hymenobacter duratus]MBR7950730.1 hypothetical protein [Microvirga sp. STR05]QNH61563.1 hypothetical protein H4317_15565 [Hymenobacter sediminicola]